MSGPVGMAVIGCGRIGESHIDGIARTPEQARLVAVADVDEARASATGARHGVPHYASLGATLENPAVEAVVICLPNDQHGPATLEAAAAGRHVLVEKPFGSSPAEALRMVQTCEKAGVTLMAAQSRRAIPAVREAKARRADIGNPLHIVYTVTRKYDRTNAPGWYRSLQATGGLAFAIMGAHAIDFSVWFMEKEPVTVFAEGSSFCGDFEGPDEGSIIVRFADGALATHVLSMNAHQQRHECYIIGTAGTMAITDVTPGVYEGVRTISTELVVNGVKVVGAEADAKPFALQIAEFTGAILERRPPAVPGRSLLTAVRVLEAAKVSALRHELVALATFDGEAYPRTPSR